MSYRDNIRPSIDVQFTKAPAIAIAGPSGCGKTESAMRLARGYCGPGEKFIVIDTEEKRALYKKARYQPWDWLDFQPPFSPENCVEVLKAVVNYKAVIFDSGSAEYDGDGGISDIQQETLERMSKGDAGRMEALSAPAWKDAKSRHKRVFMNYLRRYPTLVIVCLRAEPKVKFMKIFDERKGREVNTIVDAGYQPICEKQFMYDMLVACKMDPDKAGVPEHIKKLEPDLEPVFLDGQQINEQTGERLAVWTNLRAAGAQPKESAAMQGSAEGAQTGKGRDRDAEDRTSTAIQYPAPAADQYITPDQCLALEAACNDHGIKLSTLKEKAKVERLAQIRTDKYADAMAWIAAVIDAREKAKAAREVAA